MVNHKRRPLGLVTQIQKLRSSGGRAAFILNILLYHARIFSNDEYTTDLK